MTLDPFYLIIDHSQWLPRLAPLGVKLVQLRIKDRSEQDIRTQISYAREFCHANNIQLIINDYWIQAIDLGCDFVHLGQSDLDSVDLNALRKHGVRMGVSTHDEEELERALSCSPDYVALGPIWPTLLKKMKFAPQGLGRLKRWKQRLGSIPLVAIGGLTPARACLALASGADSACVVTDILNNPDPQGRTKEWLSATAPWRDTPELCRNFPPDYIGASVLPSPNHGVRSRSISTLVIHYTGMPTTENALELLCSPLAQVSAHYVIDEDGKILQLVPEERRAWHAGVSYWAGETDLNASSIGIEIAHPGHRDARPFPTQQIESVINLSKDICHRWNISQRRVLAHSDIAPKRKIDPGEFFPWNILAQAGVGHYVEVAPPDDKRSLGFGAQGSEVSALQQKLAQFGYRIEITGVYDEDTRVTVSAFQRHFRPARVDGQADLSTCEALHQLLACPEISCQR
jgi:N-acetylmuramoyl-L-alanine amidase